MKFLPLLVLLTAIAASAAAQNPHLDYKVGLKLYNRFAYEKRENYFSNQVRVTSKDYEAFVPAPAVQWGSGSGNFHEVELTDLRLNTTETRTRSGFSGIITGIDKITTTRVSARYEYILNFRKNVERKLVPALGFAVNPYLQRQRVSPAQSDQFRTTSHHAGARVFVTPRLSYYFSNRLFADLNVPLCLNETYLNTMTENNPNVPVAQQKQSNLTFQQFPQFLSVRLGVGVKI